MSDAIREIKEISQDSNGNYYDENDVILQKCQVYTHKGSRFWIGLDKKINSDAKVKYVNNSENSNANNRNISKKSYMLGFFKIISILGIIVVFLKLCAYLLESYVKWIGTDISTVVVVFFFMGGIGVAIWLVGALLSSGSVSVGVGYIDID